MILFEDFCTRWNDVNWNDKIWTTLSEMCKKHCDILFRDYYCNINCKLTQWKTVYMEWTELYFQFSSNTQTCWQLISEWRRKIIKIKKIVEHWLKHLEGPFQKFNLNNFISIVWLNSVNITPWLLINECC